jgi:hypothetical protein
VHLRDVLSGRRADDPAGALDQETVEGDRPRQEQGVESGCIEAFADERRRADDQDPVADLRLGEPVDCRTPIRSGHSAL